MSTSDMPTTACSRPSRHRRSLGWAGVGHWTTTPFSKEQGLSQSGKCKKRSLSDSRRARSDLVNHIPKQISDFQGPIWECVCYCHMCKIGNPGSFLIYQVRM